MADEAWILTKPNEVIEEKEKTIGGVVHVYRRRVAHFTYVRVSHGAYSWAEHNNETQLGGGATDTRVIEYGADIDPTTLKISETKTAIDKTPWYLAYTYQVGSVPGE